MGKQSSLWILTTLGINYWSMACAGDKTLTVTKSTPTVLIQDPASGSEVQQNTPYVVRGYIQDSAYKNQLDEMTVFWTIGGTTVCEDSVVDLGGNVTCDYVFDTEGEMSVGLRVVNPGGGTGEAENIITVLENLPPTAQIIAPDNSTPYYSDHLIEFIGLVSDAETSVVNLEGYWNSSINGELDIAPTPDVDGTVSGLSFLDEGEHIITFTAVETNQQSDDSIVIVVGGANHIPECAISAPLNNQVFSNLDIITLAGTASDVDVAADRLHATWVSNVDGVLSDTMVDSDGSFSVGVTGLTVGPHTVQLQIEDEVGARCTESVSIIVGAGPSAEITAPTDNTMFNHGARADFQGLVSDPQDTAQSLDITWSSNVDGLFSTQRATSSGVAVANTFILSPGTHIVTLEVTDSDGFTGSDQVSVIINDLPNAPGIALNPASPTSSNALQVSITQASTDLENDAITYSYIWQRNGIQTSHNTSTVPYTDTLRGETWSVVVIPNDGHGDGISSTSSTTILNSAPLLTSVNLSTNIVYETTSISCSQVGGYDEDGDSITYAYEWKVNGVTASTTNTLTGAAFDHGDVIQCHITPSDGNTVNGTGATVSSTPITVTNSTPVLSSANLTPTSSYESSTLTCGHPAGTDADPADVAGLQYVYDWYVNGSLQSVHTSTLDGNYFNKIDAVYCTVAPNDGMITGSSVASNTVTILNTAPVLGTVNIAPQQAREASTLSCTPQAGSYSDIDNDTITFSYDWIVNGVPLAINANTLTGANFNKGDDVYCSATPNDGTINGASVSSSTITILNTAPTISSATLSPSPADVTNTLTCTPGTTNDIDPADSVSVSYAWLVNGQPIAATSSTLTAPGHFSKNNTVTCLITPNDGSINGNAATSNTVTIQNSAPYISTVDISPTSAYEASTITCSDVGTVDPDGDTVTFAYKWYVNSNMQNVTTSQLNGAFFNKGNTVYCTMTPTDGVNTGSTVASNPITILNTAPIANAPSLSPTTATEATTFTCSNNGGSDDDPQDSVTYNFGWKVNGVNIGQNASTLNGTYFNKGDSVKCFVTPTDGSANGSSVDSGSVIVANTAPSLSSVTISPNQPYTYESLVSALGTWTDIDGDSPGYNYQWFNQNGAVVGGTNSTLPSTATNKGDIIYLRVTPTDGTNSGNAVNSNSISVQNAAPSQPTVEIQPTDAEPDEALTCTIVAASTDADGDSITYSYQWYLNGTLMPGFTTNMIPPNTTNHNDLWSCSATPSDGSTVGSAGSDVQTVADTTAPNAPVLNTILPYRNTGTVTITGTAEPLSDILLYRSCSNPNPNGSNGLSTATTIANNSGVFSVTITMTMGDDCEYYATATDAYNNVSPTSNTLYSEYCNPVDSYEISSNNGHTGNSCSDAVDMWNILNTSISNAAGNGIAITGNIISAGDEDWYVIDTAQTTSGGINYYNFQVDISTGAGSYDISVYRGSCAASSLQCTSSATYDTYNYYAQDVGGNDHGIPSDTRACGSSNTTNDCDDLSETYYIKVVRNDGVLDCTPYTLSITNGY